MTRREAGALLAEYDAARGRFAALTAAADALERHGLASREARDGAADAARRVAELERRIVAAMTDGGGE